MNTPKWGRKETIIFPPHSPIYTYGANSPGSAFFPCTGIIGSGIGCVSIYP